MRMPALPQAKDFELKRRGIFFRFLRQILAKRSVKKKSFVRIPPRK